MNLCYCQISYDTFCSCRLPCVNCRAYTSMGSYIIQMKRNEILWLLYEEIPACILYNVLASTTSPLRCSNLRRPSQAPTSTIALVFVGTTEADEKDVRHFFFIKLQSSEEILWKGPHNEFREHVGFKKLNMCCSPNECIQVSPLRRSIKIHVTAHQYSPF